MVEASPTGQPHWIEVGLQGSVPKPVMQEARYLIHRYAVATYCVLDLLDESELLQQLPQWLEETPAGSPAIPSPIFYLALAIGAQTCPEDMDDKADLYFGYGRYLTALGCMEEPSIVTVQCYAMVTFYMLGSSRRNATFMNLGIAVRAAYALGLHRHDIAKLFPLDE